MTDHETLFSCFVWLTGLDPAQLCTISDLKNYSENYFKNTVVLANVIRVIRIAFKNAGVQMLPSLL